jgi:hypothetical protein
VVGRVWVPLQAQRATYEELLKYESDNSLLDMELRRLNDGLAFVERHFIDPRGLALRPWFKHLIVAPGLHTGYAANVYPGMHPYRIARAQTLPAAAHIPHPKYTVYELCAGALEAFASFASSPEHAPDPTPTPRDPHIRHCRCAYGQQGP